MVNQMNKVRKNLPKELRVKRHAFKSATHRNAQAYVKQANARLTAVVESTNAAVEDAVETGNVKAEKKLLAVVPGKMGKNNSIVHPRLLNKKKLRKLRTAEKYAAQRAAAKGGVASMDVEMIDVQPKEGAAAQTIVPSQPAGMEVIGSGKGTTLGGPPPS
ncbi:uncharacterized protein SPPG_07584 [Spizellomyces punctatus DAOM BR117]|uniref:Uncharacterized protein n=1 Tax=Spizellomyces punctatus (strain DAOM BR117) TaxID=645134 RepID=A0A0L0H7K1_SPIPD|nr:uncharacterized protein SPPG_07584 [Spizellomyces punctatus DAOM BR117]KNC97197.1 hypothetical protein SPPG_07584 [Spizellomyces punctatus DAOM BR117]|eukprot:XP_016605237.1 hypothetical protein SPPG_07584 [Spizellomyces punctatus DAOM BR117]